MIKSNPVPPGGRHAGLDCRSSRGSWKIQRLHSCRAHRRSHVHQKPGQKQSSKFMEHKTYHAGLTQVGTC